MKNTRLLAPLILIGLAGSAPAQLSFTVSVTSVGVPVPSQSSGIAIGDLNGDGKPDLVVLGRNAQGPNNALVQFGNGNGTLTTIGFLTTGTGSAGVVIGDFNGDGKADMAISNANSKDISMLINNGGGTFKRVVSIPLGTTLEGLALGDFNGDGKLDLAIATPDTNQVMILLGKGDGTFQPPANFATGKSPIAVFVADLNGDNKADLVTVDQTSGGISILLGKGDGTFQASKQIPTGAFASSCTGGDFNGDGKQDLAVVDSTGLTVLLGKGDGTFQAPQHYSATAMSVVAGDFNRDGKLDLLVSEPGATKNVEAFQGNGDGTFESIGKVYGGNQPGSMAVGDFNGDGKPDFAAADAVAPATGITHDASTAAMYFSVLINTSTPSTAPVITGVVNGANFLPGIAASTWITIQGTNLSATTRQWGSADFVGNNLPTALDGVSATVNGLAAYVYYVSPTQLNVLAPDDNTSGQVQVQVKNANGTSNFFAAKEGPVSPAFFLFTPKYPAAVHNSGVLVGKAGLISGANFAPAKPGETILLFGTGFGPTNPPLPAGMLVSTAEPLASNATVMIGGQPAAVAFAGLSGSGLDQLNVTIPDGLPDGDAALVATVAGSSTQSSLFLTIQK